MGLVSEQSADRKINLLFMLVQPCLQQRRGRGIDMRAELARGQAACDEQDVDPSKVRARDIRVNAVADSKDPVVSISTDLRETLAGEFVDRCMWLAAMPHLAADIFINCGKGAGAGQLFFSEHDHQVGVGA